MTMPEREEGFEKVARFYSFDVTATVTDAGGESHDASATVPLGDKSTALSCTMPDKIERDSLHTIRFNYTNAAGEPLDGEVTYYIDDQRFTARTNSDQPLSAATLTSASHLLTAYCGTDTIQQHFVLFSIQDKKVATHTHDWFYTTANRFPANGQPVYVQVGSSDSVQHVLYTIFSGEKVLESDVLTFFAAIPDTFPARYNKPFQNINAFLNWALEQELIEKNPIKVHKLHKRRDDGNIKPLPVDKLQAFLASLDKSTYTGLRDYVICMQFSSTKESRRRSAWRNSMPLPSVR